MKCWLLVILVFRENVWIGYTLSKGRARLWLLSAGRYYVNLGLYPIDWSYVYDYHWQMHLFNVNPTLGMPPDTINPVWTFFPNGRRTSA